MESETADFSEPALNLTMNFKEHPDAPFSHLLNLALLEVEQFRAELPEPLAEALKNLPILLEEFPSPEHEVNGVESDQLGLFEGADVNDPDSPHMPRIVIWLGNLWEMCGADEQAYREELRITLLHEIGHCLGFDETDIFQRGLE